MENTLKFLVLTDHRVHKARNPIYSLLPTLKAHPNTQVVDIASRGNPRNIPFFEELTPQELEVLRVEKGFSYDETGTQFLNSFVKNPIEAYDAVLMRLARPVDVAFMEFLSQWDKEIRFINHPIGMERTSNKAYLLNFPSLCPPMKLCYSPEEILDFAQQFPIVLKPLKEYGGKGIIKIDGEKLHFSGKQFEIEAYLSQQVSYIKKEGYLAMKFLDQVVQGDKRIILSGDQILGSSLRLPAKGSWLCNVAQGGSSVSSVVAPEEQKIIAAILPSLRKEGILIAGIDTLVGDHGKRVLSEINTLSVGGFLNLQEQSGKPVIQSLVQIIIDYVYQKNRS